MRNSSHLIRTFSVIILLLLCTVVMAQNRRYNVVIDFDKAYISGICITRSDNDCLKASVVNEFGVSAMDMLYYSDKKKIKITRIVKKMNHWYIKRILKRDLAIVMEQLAEKGEARYTNEKRHITYSFTPLANENETSE